MHFDTIINWYCLLIWNKSMIYITVNDLMSSCILRSVDVYLVGFHQHFLILLIGQKYPQIFIPHFQAMLYSNLSLFTLKCMNWMRWLVKMSIPYELSYNINKRKQHFKGILQTVIQLVRNSSGVPRLFTLVSLLGYWKTLKRWDLVGISQQYVPYIYIYIYNQSP